MDKCKIVNGNRVLCSGWMKETYMLISSKGSNYCKYCGEPLKEPIPERIEPIFNKCDHGETLYNHTECIYSINDRIDYILERLDK